MMLSWLAEWWGQLMHMRRRSREELPEKEEFQQAKVHAEEARKYARESIETAKREMTWLEDALTPPDARRRQDWRQQQ